MMPSLCGISPQLFLYLLCVILHCLYYSVLPQDFLPYVFVRPFSSRPCQAMKLSQCYCRLFFLPPAMSDHETVEMSIRLFRSLSSQLCYEHVFICLCRGCAGRLGS